MILDFGYDPNKIFHGYGHAGFSNSFMFFIGPVGLVVTGTLNYNDGSGDDSDELGWEFVSDFIGCIHDDHGNEWLDCGEEETSSGPWPSCINLPGEECKVYIESKAPNLDGVFIINPGDMHTRDINMNRVRIFVNEEGVVFKAPKRG